MKKVVTVIGARPQFIKAAPVSRLLRNHAREILVHTGQHYDQNMSDVFFRELNIPQPDYNLGVGSGTHGFQTAEMLTRIEALLTSEEPDWVLVFGDTNSTLAGALAAAKLHIPVAHAEAGVRSFDKRMPEEVNRVLTDHVATILLAPTLTAVNNLANEGLGQNTVQTGDVMYDALLQYADQVGRSTVLQRLGVHSREYFLLTMHRAGNVDDPEMLRSVFSALSLLGSLVIFPVHPRTKKLLTNATIETLPRNVLCVDPVGYLDMIRLESDALAVLTDSGGVQKEAFLLGVPCITLRDETEWPETVDAGANVLIGARPEPAAVAQAATKSAKRPRAKAPAVNPFGDGKATEKVVHALISEGNTLHGKGV